MEGFLIRLGSLSLGGKKKFLCFSINTLKLENVFEINHILCDACQNLWDKDPVGICSRKTNGQFSLCKSCFYKIRDRGIKVAEGHILFDFNNTDSCVVKKNHNICLTKCIFSTKKREIHEDETLNRIRWCLDHNHLPAHENVHLAPGDDSRFMVCYFPPFG